MSLRPLLLAGAMLLVSAAGGCASDEGPRPIDPAVDLHSPSGTRRAQAVQLVGQAGDHAYVPELIEMLDDRDETVRLQAHATLKALTGHDTGYRPFEDRAQRAEHVLAWQAWWAERDEAGEGAPGE